MKDYGVDLVSLANNHAMDFGWEATQETSQHLQKAKIKWSGVGKNSFFARKPFKVKTPIGIISFFSFNMTFPQGAWANSKRPGVAYPYPEVLERVVRESAKLGEHPVVIFHWGRESTTQLREYQPRVAKIAIDAGAYAIFGHHAHIAQGFELFKKRPISYGLGNFIFTSWAHHGAFSLGALLRMCTAHDRVQVLLVPLNTNPRETHFYTQPLTIVETKKLMKTFYKHSHFADAEFYFPKENRVMTIASLLKI